MIERAVEASDTSLTEFAETAKHRLGICIFAQVDSTGSEEANKKVAQARADEVQAVFDFATNRAKLDRAVGRLSGY